MFKYYNIILIAVFLSCFQMASAFTQTIGFDSVSSGMNGSAGNSLSFSHTIGSGSDRILVVGLGAEDGSVADMEITS
ncbi:MAG: hypothetical protein V3V70_06050, partial [Candidatus Scalindua sp.]